MSTYGTMQDRIASELKRSNLTSQIPLAIQSAIRYYEAKRFWFNEGEATTSTSTGTPNVAAPSDLIAMDTLTITVNSWRYPITPRTWQWYRDTQTLATLYTNRPTDYAYYADQLWLYPTPDAAYTLTLSYHKKLTTLSATTDTNAWVADMEELIRSRAKWDLATNVIRSPEIAQMAAAVMSQAEAEAFRETVTRQTTGRVRPSYF